MKILDPRSGETIDTDSWDQTNLALMPNLRATQNRMLARGVYSILTEEWDNELGQLVATVTVEED